MTIHEASVVRPGRDFASIAASLLEVRGDHRRDAISRAVLARAIADPCSLSHFYIYSDYTPEDPVPALCRYGYSPRVVLFGIGLVPGARNTVLSRVEMLAIRFFLARMLAESEARDVAAA